MKSFLFLTLALVSTTTWALPQAPFNALAKTQAISNFDDLAYDFEGIIKLSNCSGSLVAFAGQPLTAKAIVMTNGHCIGTMPKPGEVVVNRPLVRNMKVFDGSMKLSPVSSTSILYAT